MAEVSELEKIEDEVYNILHILDDIPPELCGNEQDAELKAASLQNSGDFMENTTYNSQKITSLISSLASSDVPSEFNAELQQKARVICSTSSDIQESLGSGESTVLTGLQTKRQFQTDLSIENLREILKNTTESIKAQVVNKNTPLEENVTKTNEDKYERNSFSYSTESPSHRIKYATTSADKSVTDIDTSSLLRLSVTPRKNKESDDTTNSPNILILKKDMFGYNTVKENLLLKQRTPDVKLEDAVSPLSENEREVQDNVSALSENELDSKCDLTPEFKSELIKLDKYTPSEASLSSCETVIFERRSPPSVQRFEERSPAPTKKWHYSPVFNSKEVFVPNRTPEKGDRDVECGVSGSDTIHNKERKKRKKRRRHKRSEKRKKVIEDEEDSDDSSKCAEIFAMLCRERYKLLQSIKRDSSNERSPTNLCLEPYSPLHRPMAAKSSSPEKPIASPEQFTQSDVLRDRTPATSASRSPSHCRRSSERPYSDAFQKRQLKRHSDKESHSPSLSPRCNSRKERASKKHFELSRSRSKTPLWTRRIRQRSKSGSNSPQRKVSQHTSRRKYRKSSKNSSSPGRLASSISRNSSVERKSTRHLRRSPYSRRRSPSPRRRSPSPRRRSPSPRRRSPSPRRRSPSPRRRSPRRRSPRRRSPRRRSPSPRRRSPSPRRRSPSPRRRSPCSRRKSPSPRRKSSLRRSHSPRKHPSSPIWLASSRRNTKHSVTPPRYDAYRNNVSSPTIQWNCSSSRSPDCRITTKSLFPREKILAVERTPSPSLQMEEKDPEPMVISPATEKELPKDANQSIPMAISPSPETKFVKESPQDSLNIPLPKSPTLHQPPPPGTAPTTVTASTSAFVLGVQQFASPDIGANYAPQQHVATNHIQISQHAVQNPIGYPLPQIQNFCPTVPPPPLVMHSYPTPGTQNNYQKPWASYSNATQLIDSQNLVVYPHIPHPASATHIPLPTSTPVQGLPPPLQIEGSTYFTAPDKPDIRMPPPNYSQVRQHPVYKPELQTPNTTKYPSALGNQTVSYFPQSSYPIHNSLPTHNITQSQTHIQINVNQILSQAERNNPTATTSCIHYRDPRRKESSKAVTATHLQNPNSVETIAPAESTQLANGQLQNLLTQATSVAPMPVQPPLPPKEINKEQPPLPKSPSPPLPNEGDFLVAKKSHTPLYADLKHSIMHNVSNKIIANPVTELSSTSGSDRIPLANNVLNTISEVTRNTTTIATASDLKQPKKSLVPGTASDDAVIQLAVTGTSSIPEENDKRSVTSDNSTSRTQEIDKQSTNSGNKFDMLDCVSDGTLVEENVNRIEKKQYLFSEVSKSLYNTKRSIVVNIGNRKKLQPVTAIVKPCVHEIQPNNPKSNIDVICKQERLALDETKSSDPETTVNSESSERFELQTRHTPANKSSESVMKISSDGKEQLSHRPSDHIEYGVGTSEGDSNKSSVLNTVDNNEGSSQIIECVTEVSALPGTSSNDVARLRHPTSNRSSENSLPSSVITGNRSQKKLTGLPRINRSKSADSTLNYLEQPKEADSFNLPDNSKLYKDGKPTLVQKSKVLDSSIVECDNVFIKKEQSFNYMKKSETFRNSKHEIALSEQLQEQNIHSEISSSRDLVSGSNSVKFEGPPKDTLKTEVPPTDFHNKHNLITDTSIPNDSEETTREIVNRPFIKPEKSTEDYISKDLHLNTENKRNIADNEDVKCCVVGNEAIPKSEILTETSDDHVEILHESIIKRKVFQQQLTTELASCIAVGDCISNMKYSNSSEGPLPLQQCSSSNKTSHQDNSVQILEMSVGEVNNIEKSFSQIDSCEMNALTQSPIPLDEAIKFFASDSSDCDIIELPPTIDLCVSDIGDDKDDDIKEIEEPPKHIPVFDITDDNPSDISTSECKEKETTLGEEMVKSNLESSLPSSSMTNVSPSDKLDGKQDAELSQNSLEQLLADLEGEKSPSFSGIASFCSDQEKLCLSIHDKILSPAKVSAIDSLLVTSPKNNEQNFPICDQGFSPGNVSGINSQLVTSSKNNEQVDLKLKPQLSKKSKSPCMKRKNTDINKDTSFNASQVNDLILAQLKPAPKCVKLQKQAALLQSKKIETHMSGLNSIEEQEKEINSDKNVSITDCGTTTVLSVSHKSKTAPLRSKRKYDDICNSNVTEQDAEISRSSSGNMVKDDDSVSKVVKGNDKDEQCSKKLKHSSAARNIQDRGLESGISERTECLKSVKRSLFSVTALQTISILPSESVRGTISSKARQYTSRVWASPKKNTVIFAAYDDGNTSNEEDDEEEGTSFTTTNENHSDSSDKLNKKYPYRSQLNSYALSKRALITRLRKCPIVLQANLKKTAKILRQDPKLIEVPLVVMERVDQELEQTKKTV